MNWLQRAISFPVLLFSGLALLFIIVGFADLGQRQYIGVTDLEQAKQLIVQYPEGKFQFLPDDDVVYNFRTKDAISGLHYETETTVYFIFPMVEPFILHTII